MFCMNWEIRCNWESRGHCESVSGFSRGPEGKALGIFTIFSFKLVWYSLLEEIKLKLSNKNCYYNLKYAQLCVLSFIRSRMSQR